MTDGNLQRMETASDVNYTELGKLPSVVMRTLILFSLQQKSSCFKLFCKYKHNRKSM